jgi:hypothetical protein
VIGRKIKKDFWARLIVKLMKSGADYDRFKDGASDLEDGLLLL